MKKGTGVLTLCIALLFPGVARADDGGFWDWLFHWDTKFTGYGTEFHVACWTAEFKKVEYCEEWFRNIPNLFHPERSTHVFTTSDGRETTKVEFAEIAHEVNIRVSYMHSYGQRVPDEKLAPDDLNTNDHRTVHAVKLLAVYNRRLDDRWKRIELSAGGGIIPLWGEDVHSVWRGVVSGSLLYPLGSIFYVRGDATYLTNTVTGADLGHPASSFSADPGFNAAISIGFDLRRVGIFNAAPAR